MLFGKCAAVVAVAATVKVAAGYIYTCSCVVVDSRSSENNWTGVVQRAGERSGLTKKNKKTWGFLCTYSAQRGGTQPNEKKSPLSDVKRSEHRHGARPGSRHAS